MMPCPAPLLAALRRRRQRRLSPRLFAAMPARCRLICRAMPLRRCASEAPQRGHLRAIFAVILRALFCPTLFAAMPLLPRCCYADDAAAAVAAYDDATYQQQYHTLMVT
jgi:hypothetical protein